MHNDLSNTKFSYQQKEQNKCVCKYNHIFRTDFRKNSQMSDFVWLFLVPTIWDISGCLFLFCLYFESASSFVLGTRKLSNGALLLYHSNSHCFISYNIHTYKVCLLKAAHHLIPLNHSRLISIQKIWTAIYDLLKKAVFSILY